MHAAGHASRMANDRARRRRDGMGPAATPRGRRSKAPLWLTGVGFVAVMILMLWLMIKFQG